MVVATNVANFHIKCTAALQEAEAQGKQLVFTTGPGEKFKANAAVLVSCPGSTTHLHVSRTASSKHRPPLSAQ